MPIVPLLLVASVRKQQGLTSAVSLWLSVPFLLLYWVMLWQIGLYLPVETSGEVDHTAAGAEESIMGFFRVALDVGKSVSRLSVVGVTTAAVNSVVTMGVQFPQRSEAGRVGKECVSKCRSRWSP